MTAGYISYVISLASPGFVSVIVIDAAWFSYQNVPPGAGMESRCALTIPLLMLRSEQ